MGFLHPLPFALAELKAQRRLCGARRDVAGSA
jgi:hypothetical protein